MRGVGDTYLVSSAQTRYILRVYRSTHRTAPQVKEELALLLALREAGVPVSYPIADKAGNTIQFIEAAEGERCAVLFSYAPGQVERQLSATQLRSLGTEMARFHRVSAVTDVGQERWPFNAQTTLFEPLDKLQPAFNADPEGYAWLQQMANRAAAKQAALSAGGLAGGYCHFDFLPKNFHFDQDRVTFFDFDFMGYGWLVNDIMTFWQHLVLEVYTGRMKRAAAREAYDIFLESYHAHRPLSKAELAAVPYLAPGFWLFYMGFHTTHDQFYAFSQPAQVQAYLGIIRHIVDTYWDREGEGPGLI